jgi:hypothetical protein
MNNISQKQQKRFIDAKQNFEEIQRILAPFIKPRLVVRNITEGQWKKASDENFFFSNEFIGNRTNKQIEIKEDE